MDLYKMRKESAQRTWDSAYQPHWSGADVSDLPGSR